MQEREVHEDESDQLKLGKRKYSKNVKSLNMTVTSNEEDLKTIMKPPLVKEDIVEEIAGLQEGNNYLIVYTDTIEGLNIGMPPGDAEKNMLQINEPISKSF